MYGPCAPLSKLQTGGVITGLYRDYIGSIIGVIKGDTRTLDYGSYDDDNFHTKSMI